MKRHQKEIIKLASKELFLLFFDIFISSQKFSPSYGYRRLANKYLEKRNYDQKIVYQKIKYWQRQGYINSFVGKKEKYIELTKKGRRYLFRLSLSKIKIKRPKRWDGKWRVVIFDIPEKLRHQRDIIRDKLISLGFRRIQMSVYVYPFECTREVRTISKRLFIDRCVLIMISEIIQGEKKIIDDYLRHGILNKSDLKIR